MFSNVLALKNTPKILKKEVRYGPKSTFFSVFFLDRFFLIFCSHFGSILVSLGAPGASFLTKMAWHALTFCSFFSKVRSVVPLWAPKVTPRVAQGPSKAAPRSLFGHFWTTLGHFLVDFDHFRAPFRSLLLAFGDVLRVSLISVDFYDFPTKFLTFPLKILTFSSWKVWSILAV